MQNISFEIDPWGSILALVLLSLCYGLARKKEQMRKSSLLFSHLHPSFLNAGWKTTFSQLPRWLHGGGLILFLVALTNPHLFVRRPPLAVAEKGDKNFLPTEGIAIYLLLDQSGSMAEEVTATLDSKRQNISKEALLKQVTKEFIQGNPSAGLKGRANDLIGLITFARVPHILSPLTLDHQQILKALAHIQVVKKQEDNGTAMGYAIYKTVSMIAATKYYANHLAQKNQPAYNIKNSIIILVTDGLQDPNILDKNSLWRNLGLKEAAVFAKEKGVRLYFINIDPRIYADQLSSQRRQMEEITQLTGGRLFILNDPGEMKTVYATIDRLEKSILLSQEFAGGKPPIYQQISFSPYLIAGGMLMVWLAIVLQTTLLRKVP
ncbi:VWA domain-containing protein [Neochlamydia sp. EPS4]|uniref:vWA domain-containing protein n=1 Tax=Neochlamydia sp. EPS4 TaxID=1478175 RepID=UPI0005D1295F|nr:VWA domain-containing protein [Neochlamydia sp. EPS4]